ncbi:unnamed protein product [Ambrosiozyma monospora]|uniref:Unnamed protein product n=1 Tax=Ambrosiozyma monospora TaxID=43982 RepID=A0ACB5U3Y7_AMBMO|nr:unnamed protein product [Ambrosiozyma monospora]
MYLALEYLPFVENKSSTNCSQINDKLRSNGINHNDIHARNMCVDDKGKIFLFDFGEAQFDNKLFNRSRPASSESENSNESGTLVNDSSMICD